VFTPAPSPSYQRLQDPHTHQRTTLAELLADAQAWAHTITPAEVLSQIGSPFALDHRPMIAEELNHAAGTPRKHLGAR
jgi:hypothetical protein